MAAESLSQVCFLFTMLIRAKVDQPESASVKTVPGAGKEVVLDILQTPALARKGREDICGKLRLKAIT